MYNPYAFDQKYKYSKNKKDAQNVGQFGHVLGFLQQK